MAVFEGNWEKVAAALGLRVDRMWHAATTGAVLGMRQFSGFIQKTQMSGRPGLKAPTGTLKRSWHVKVDGSGGDTVVTLGTSTRYAIAHELGMTIKHPGTHNGFGRGIAIPPHDIKMPKRLHVTDAYHTQGRRMVVRKIGSAIHREARR